MPITVDDNPRLGPANLAALADGVLLNPVAAGTVVVTAAPAGDDDRRKKPKRRRRSKQERGLPDEQSLIELAMVWLEHQNRLWPELVGAGLAPAKTTENAIALAAAFRRRFLGEEVVQFTLPPGVVVELAAS